MSQMENKDKRNRTILLLAIVLSHPAESPELTP
jgi:hypothetical protein